MLSRKQSNYPCCVKCGERKRGFEGRCGYICLDCGEIHARSRLRYNGDTVDMPAGGVFDLSDLKKRGKVYEKLQARRSTGKIT